MEKVKDNVIKDVVIDELGLPVTTMAISGLKSMLKDIHKTLNNKLD